MLGIIQSGLCILLAIGIASCVGGEGPSPLTTPSRLSSPSTSLERPSDSPSRTTSLADDFSDPSSGWDANGTATYLDGKLSVGNPLPAGILVPSPRTFEGPAVLTVTASVDGPGRSVIGLFCFGSLDLSSAYVGFVDLSRALATVGRLSSAGAEIMGRGKHIDEVVSLAEPVLLGLTCTRAGGIHRISLQVSGERVALGVDPAPLEGSLGGLYFEHSQGGTVGLFDDFDMHPIAED